jgi:hypothetical protein
MQSAGISMANQVSTKSWNYESSQTDRLAQVARWEFATPQNVGLQQHPERSGKLSAMVLQKRLPDTVGPLASEAPVSAAVLRIPHVVIIPES